ncbi:MAG: aldolase/citrate lyase family protein [Parvularcula sp.]|jgi:2-keto-3-deoxy-L-rhamnonate aldolase RhmA|nr:aldolase/citrate lyase family protein [Parvularcula sp.]
MIASFRDRLLSGEALIGTWAKTPSMISAEVLGRTPLDCICLDAEHAPFDRADLDAGILALRSQSMPALVRVPALSAEHVLSSLDCGATGIVAPHVRSAADAAALAKMCHYGAGGRGYAGSSRAAGYTTKAMADHLVDSRAETTVIAQIEDLEALDDLDAIAQVEGIDCLFVGRIDLTVAMGAASPKDAQVVEAVESICAAGVAADRRVGMFVGDLDEIPRWINAGATLFILKSDHSFLLEGARSLRDDFDRLVSQTR